MAQKRRTEGGGLERWGHKPRTRATARNQERETEGPRRGRRLCQGFDIRLPVPRTVRPCYSSHKALITTQGRRRVDLCVIQVFKSTFPDSMTISLPATGKATFYLNPSHFFPFLQSQQPLTAHTISHRQGRSEVSLLSNSGFRQSTASIHHHRLLFVL